LAQLRDERRRQRGAALRPRPPRLLPDLDSFEERSSLGLGAGTWVQVALLGGGVAVLAEALRPAILYAESLPSPTAAPTH
jgi:hypothetical protein